MISYDEALRLTLEHIEPLEGETVVLEAAVGRTVIRDMVGLVDSPSADVSLKDGYAVHSADIAEASVTHPVGLQLVGSVSAGGRWRRPLLEGTAIRVLSGAPVPKEADAVVAEEFVHTADKTILVNKVKTISEAGRAST